MFRCNDIELAKSIMTKNGSFENIKLISNFENINMHETLVFSNDSTKIPQYGFYIAPRKIEESEFNEITDVPLKQFHNIFENLEFITS